MRLLYLVECQYLYKIGITANVKRRLFTMQTGNPFPLRLLAIFEFPDAKMIEKIIHTHFAVNQYKREWFLFKQKNIEEFLRLCYDLGGIEMPTFDIETEIENELYKQEKEDYDET